MKKKIVIIAAITVTLLVVGAVILAIKLNDNPKNVNGDSNQTTQEPTTEEIPSHNDYVTTLKSKNLYVEAKMGNGISYDLIKMQKIDTSYYLFLPTVVDNTRLVLWENYDADVYIDDKIIVNGERYELTVGKHTVKIGDTTSTLEVMMSANVPSVFIKTEKENDLSTLKSSKSAELPGEIAFVDTDGKVTSVAMERIRGRGNTSWSAGALFDKYPFNIKLQDKTNVFGMGNNKDWCIIPQVFDESLIRNVLSNDLARAAGLENTPNAENVDVYFNGEYIGTYLLSQKVDMGKNKLIPSEDGFLVECELMERYDAEEYKFITDRYQAVIVKEFNSEDASMVYEIQDYIQRVEDAVYSRDGYNSQGEHYSDLIDVDSFVKVYLINEFSMNLDGGATSFFMYKSGDDKLKAGPVWDFDWAYGSYAYRNGVNLAKGEDWYIRYKNLYDGSELALMAKLCSRPEFWKKVKAEWSNSFKGYVTAQLNGGSLTSIDEYMAKYQATAAMNFTRYNILPTCEWGSADTGSTYKDNINYLKSFYERRIDFLNAAM